MGGSADVNLNVHYIFIEYNKKSETLNRWQNMKNNTEENQSNIAISQRQMWKKNTALVIESNNNTNKMLEFNYIKYIIGFIYIQISQSP